MWARSRQQGREALLSEGEAPLQLQLSKKQREVAEPEQALHGSGTEEISDTKSVVESEGSFGAVVEPEPVPSFASLDFFERKKRRSITSRSSPGSGLLPWQEVPSSPAHSRRGPNSRRPSRNTGAHWPACIEMRKSIMDLSGDLAGGRISCGEHEYDREYSWQDQEGTTFFSSSSIVGTLDPNSSFVIALDMLGITVLANDLFVSPFLLAWDLRAEGSLAVLAWCTGIYWILDMVITFRKGYFFNGQLNMKQGDIAMAYVRSWFLPDLTLLICDWFPLITNPTGQASFSGNGRRMQQAAKAFRVIKIVRVMRIVRLMDKAALWSVSSTWRVGLLIIKIVFAILFINHFLACGWFLIGRHAPSDTGKRWFNLVAFQSDDAASYYLLEQGLLYQYIVTLHWVTAVMTLASCYVEPSNSFEGIVSISLLMCGLLLGGTIVALFSSQIVQVAMDKQEETHKLATLCHFLHQRSIPRTLAYRVQKQVIERFHTKIPLAEEDVSALMMLSKTLRGQLLYATRMPFLMSHHLFKLWELCEVDALRRLCECVTFVFYTSQDIAFTAKADAEECYLVARGRLNYLQFPESSFVEKTTVVHINDGTWLCEAALWSQWVHVGTLEAITTCQVLVVKAEVLLGIASQHETVARSTLEYATNYFARITSAMPPHADWPTDLYVPFTEASDLLSHDVGLGLLKRAYSTSAINMTEDEYSEFTSELFNGRCALQQSSNGDLERVVAVVALRLAQSDGSLFVQIGKWDKKTGVTCLCLLPGTKRRKGELPQEALARLLLEDLSDFQDAVQVVSAKHEMQVQDAKYGVKTKYLRTEHFARLLHPPDLPIAENTESDFELDIPVRDVFMLPDGDDISLYAWLLPTEFDLLRAPGNKHMLKPWLSTLGFELKRTVSARSELMEFI